MNYWPKRDDPHFQSVMNTYILVSGFAVSFISLGVIYQTQVGNDKEVQSWIVRHELMHKDRQVAIDSFMARTDERVRKLEQDTGKLENLNYRITVNETVYAALQKSLEEVKGLIADQGSDLRVMREVLAPNTQLKQRR